MFASSPLIVEPFPSIVMSFSTKTPFLNISASSYEALKAKSYGNTKVSSALSIKFFKSVNVPDNMLGAASKTLKDI